MLTVTAARGIAMYKVRTDIPQDKRNRLFETAITIVPNNFEGTLTIEFTKGMPRRVFQEKDEE